MRKVHRPSLPEIKTIEVSVGVRYWEDFMINGESSVEGENVPCRKNGLWCPIIDAETGEVYNWTKGMTASVHVKVCDQFSAIFYNSDGKPVVTIEDEYVPDFMAIDDNGYGDYIIMEVDANGFIKNWEFNQEALVTDIEES